MTPRYMYHGTDTIINTVNLDKSRLRTDFGKGFYLSSKLGVARDWAVDKSGALKTPTVMRLTMDIEKLNASDLVVLRFDQPNVEWLNFIRDNRQINAIAPFFEEPRHNYDIVSGPIANDKVAQVVVDYIDGLISADEAIRKTKALPSVFQISLHTQKALISIVHSEYQQRLSNGKWSEWIKVETSAEKQ